MSEEINVCCELNCEKQAEFAIEAKSNRKSYEDYTHCCSEHLSNMISKDEEFTVYRIASIENVSNSFEDVVRPVIKYLCENHHPHTLAIIEPTGAVLYEGLRSTGDIYDYLKD